LDMGPGVPHLAQLNKVPQHVLGRTDTVLGMGRSSLYRRLRALGLDSEEEEAG
jgi:hypothetical protein